VKGKAFPMNLHCHGDESLPSQTSQGIPSDSFLQEVQCCAVSHIHFFPVIKEHNENEVSVQMVSVCHTYLLWCYQEWKPFKEYEKIQNKFRKNQEDIRENKKNKTKERIQR
jgi:hypothetical protein